MKLEGKYAEINDTNTFNIKEIEEKIDAHRPSYNATDNTIMRHIATQLAISNKIQLEILKTMWITDAHFPFNTFRDKTSAKEGVSPETLNKIVSEAPKVTDFVYDINGKKINLYEV